MKNSVSLKFEITEILIFVLNFSTRETFNEIEIYYLGIPSWQMYVKYIGFLYRVSSIIVRYFSDSRIWYLSIDTIYYQLSILRIVYPDMMLI